MAVTHRCRGGRRGFSLIEVNLAILLIGLGLLVVFSLFPSALREGESGFIDTHAALFASAVLDGLHARSSAMTWTEWQNLNGFSVQLKGGATVGRNTTVTGPIQFPSGSDTYIHYVMETYGDADARTRGVTLWVWSGKYAPKNLGIFKSRAEWYYTRCYFSGMQ